MEEEARTRARVTKCEDVAGPLPAAVDNNTNNIIIALAVACQVTAFLCLLLQPRVRS